MVEHLFLERSFLAITWSNLFYKFWAICLGIERGKEHLLLFQDLFVLLRELDEVINCISLTFDLSANSWPRWSDRLGVGYHGQRRVCSDVDYSFSFLDVEALFGLQDFGESLLILHH